ncbi:hypothetical protein O181_000284 [Austropuccinia psidii MF-1]|uniref:Uncharacterized protein n=1 Tax=Austropuccinia psidii MF-1 TaxID=1389203 RepID=A0A9Q3GAS3_9BASI|nr:hypothetical protein [Austropuccinia psidii MF-1]
MPIYKQVTSPEMNILLPFSPDPSIHNEKHSEAHFLKHLIYMFQPGSLTWAKIIAASVSDTMDEFCIPKPPGTTKASIDEVNILLDIIAYFECLRRPSISPMELISMAWKSPSGANNADYA